MGAVAAIISTRTAFLGWKKPNETERHGMHGWSSGGTDAEESPHLRRRSVAHRGLTRSSRALDGGGELGCGAQSPIMPVIVLRWMSDVPEYIRPQVASR